MTLKIEGLYEKIFIIFFLQYELEQLKAKLEKLEKERNEYKTQSEKMENRVSVVSRCVMCKSLLHHNTTK